MWFTKMANVYEMLFVGRFIIGVNCGKLFENTFNASNLS